MINLKKLLITTFAVIGCGLLVMQPAYSNCQIPCCIYDDHARVKSMLEDAATT